MKIELKRMIVRLIPLVLAIGCAPTPQPDRVSPTSSINSPSPYGATLVKSPDASTYMNRLVVAPDGAVWFSFGSYDWSHPYGGGLGRYSQGQLTHFTSDDGLPSDNVQALRVAPDGSVWVGALCGIARYADRAWHIINEAANCQSVGGPVIDFAFTPDGGSVWAGTALNVARFDGQQWTRYGNMGGYLAATRDGSVWAVGLDGDGLYLARFAGSAWTKIEQPYRGGSIIGLGDSVWAMQPVIDIEHSQLTRLDGRSAETILVPTSGLFNVAIAPDGVLWALTSQGLARFNGAQWLYDTGISGDFTRIVFAPDGTLWLGGRGGQLSHYRPATGQLTVAVTPLPTPTPLLTYTPDPNAAARSVGPAPSPSITPIPQLPVTNLVVTPDGTVWYSFGNFDFYPRRGGVVRDVQGRQTRFMPEATVQLLKVAPDGSLWAGAGCSLMRFDGQAWQTVIENCDRLHGNVVDLAFTSDGATWIAAGFKLARYQNDEWTIVDRLIGSVAITPNGTLWASGWDGTLGSQYVARFDGKQWTTVERAVIRELRANTDGSVWGIKDELLASADGTVRGIGNGHSLVRFAGANSQTFTNLPFDQINDLVSAPNGDMWAITDRGVVRFDGTQWQQASNLSDNVTQIAFAPDGSIWVGDQVGKVLSIDPTTIPFTIMPAWPTSTPLRFDPSLPNPPPTPDPLPTQQPELTPNASEPILSPATSCTTRSRSAFTPFNSGGTSTIRLARCSAGL